MIQLLLVAAVLAQPVPGPHAPTPVANTTTPVPSAPPPAPLGKAGALGMGINLELLSLGMVQALSAGGAEPGFGIATALQFDTGPRWALRFPIALDATAGSTHGGFAAISLTPGMVYRWRTVAEQRLVPYAGGGLKLGAFGAGHELLGQPVVTRSALGIGEHHIDLGGHSDDPNFEARVRVAPEVWGGLEVHTSSWFAVDLGATYAWIRVAGENVHLLREFVGARFSI